MPVQLLTKSAYARHRGCDEKAVRKAIAENRITALTVDGKEMIDPEVADIQWARNTRARADSRRQAPDAPAGLFPAQPERPAPPSGQDAGPADPIGDYNDARTRRERAEAERAELETAKLAGRLVDRAQAEAAAFDAFRRLRDVVMAVPRECAPRLVGLPDVREIEHAISDDLRKAFDVFETRSLEALRARLGPATT